MYGFIKIHPSQVLDERIRQQPNLPCRPSKKTTQWKAHQLHAEGYQQGIGWHMTCWSTTDTSGQQSAVWPKFRCWWKQLLVYTQASSNSFIILSFYEIYFTNTSTFCEVSVNGGGEKKSRQKSNLEKNSPHKVRVSVLIDTFFLQCTS